MKFVKFEFRRDVRLCIESGEAVAEESVVVTERDADKTPVMELLQRLSESDDLQSQQTEPLQLRM